MTLSQDQLDAREAWIRKLEQNDLPQTKGMMVGRTANGQVGFCCLAVAEFVRGHRPEKKPYLSSLIINGQCSAMSAQTSRGMGFAEVNPYLHRIPQVLADRVYEENGYKYPPITLSALNDTYSLTFPEIASLVRMQPENWNGSWIESDNLEIVA